MKRETKVALILVSMVIMLAPVFADEQTTKNADKDSPAATTRPKPKELSNNVKTALEWLVKNQLDNGAWAQGEESTNMGTSLDKIKGTPNVADTCMVIMALYRSGSTPKDGPYKENLLKAVKFVCAQIEESDADSLKITSLQGTRTQQKLGTYIDTFMAAQALAELKGLMPDKESTKRVEDAVAKVIGKMEKNQGKDGQWKNEGWAPALAQAQASKALNVAAANGTAVSDGVREKAENYARQEYKDRQAGKSSGKDAGVELYSTGGQIAAMQSSANSNELQKQELDKVISSSSSQPAEVAAAKARLADISANGADLKKAQDEVVAKMTDQKFISGFGSNGGEEFLSYLNLGESLFQRGGQEWEKWDKSITDNLNNIQNKDGSWSGHHCITGRTFCTAAAMMVLTIDRSPAPGAAKIQQAKK